MQYVLKEGGKLMHKLDRDFILGEIEVKEGNLILRDDYSKGRGSDIVVLKENIDCLICTSHSGNNRGTVTLRRLGKPITLANYIYKVYKGDIPEGYVLYRNCNNIKCINPEHLFIKPILDNNKNKGRSSNLPKLNEKIVVMIKKDLENKNLSQQKIAEKYGINQGLVSRIKNGKAW